MTNRKNYNSIIFLSTLCLGLVLVGATPYISSQFALTKIDEIPIVENLDQLPDDDADFQNLILSLLKEIKKEAKIEKVPLPLQNEFEINASYEKDQYGEGSSVGSTISDQRLSILIQESFHKKFTPKAFEMADFDGQRKDVKIKLEANKTKIEFEISFTKSNPQGIVEFLNNHFSNSRDKAKSLLVKEVYQNSVARSQNNQVFIVTRLPRGSIDSLLK